MQKIIFLLLIGFPPVLIAQTIRPTVLNTAGGTHSFGYTQIDWSVGEIPLVNTAGGQGVVVTNGVLQSFTEKTGSTDYSSAFTPDEIRVFPNPATHYVEVNFFVRQTGRINFRLYNSLGQLLFDRSFQNYGLGRIERINVQQLPATEYFLHVVLEPESGLRRKGGYKIIKLD